MADKLKIVFSSAGFRVVLAAAVLAAALGGWLLLVNRETPAEAPPQAAVSAPAEEAAPAPVVEAVSPAVSIPAPAAMPEETPAPVVEPDAAPVVAEAPRLVVSPLRGAVVAAFSVDQLQYNETLADWRTHDGQDIAADAGTAVLAASAGTVAAVTDDALMGTTVTISHDGGYQTVYANLQAKPAVSAGDTVTPGQVIGAVGTTAAAESAQGPHLHFAVTKDGDALDPEEFLSK